MITPHQLRNPQVKPKWQLPVGVMESVVAYNCRKYGMPRPVLTVPMWEGAGNRTIDISGYGNHGTIYGPSWEGGWLKFDNGTSRVEMGAFSPVTPRTPLTINIQLYYDSSQGVTYPRLFWDADYEIDILVRHSDLMLSLRGGTYYAVNPIPTNQWFNLTIVATSTTNGKIYFDDVFQEDLGGTFEDNVGTIRLGNRGDNARPFEGNMMGVNVYDVCLNATQVKFLYDNPYFMYEIPEELYGYAVAVGDTATNLLHGKIIIKDSSIILVDGLVKVQDTVTNLFDGELKVIDKVTSLADGKLQVQDVDTDLADGKLQVKDSITSLADGKLQVQDSATGLADGLIQVKDSVIDLADGKVIVTTAGLDTGYADGKIQIKDVTTGIVDGLVKVKDSVTGLADGKVKISNIGSNLADGLIQIKDTVTGIADGKIQIKDISTIIADGKISIKDKITSLLDGIIKIKEKDINIVDGKVIISGGAAGTPFPLSITILESLEYGITMSESNEYSIAITQSGG